MHFLTKLGYYPAGKITTTFVPLLEKVFFYTSEMKLQMVYIIDQGLYKSRTIVEKSSPVAKTG